MEFQTLIYEETNGIGLLKVNRPKALNALNAEVLKELNLFLDNAEKSASLRCLILTGNSEKAFVAGADISEIAELNVEQAMKFAEHGQKTLMRLETLPVPVIAAVNGFALGGGLELALACDFIICSNKARFGLPEVSLGIMPGFGGTQRLWQAVGLRRAREMTFTGNHYDAQAAKEMGLVNQVTEPEGLIEAAMKLAQAIGQRAPIAVTQSKQAILQGADATLAEGMHIEAKAFAELFNTQDAKEGTQAFLQKRAPEFQGQ
jgi:enoyl-CoA hydratase